MLRPLYINLQIDRDYLDLIIGRVKMKMKMAKKVKQKDQQHSKVGKKIKLSSHSDLLW